MKKLFVMAVLICLLLCGCGKDTQPSTTPDEESAASASSQSDTASTESTTKPEPTTETTATSTTKPQQTELVTVYLLKETVYFDSGFTKYNYDEQYNIDSFTDYDIERAPRYTAYFEAKNANGMAGVYRTSGEVDSVSTLVWHDDGKIKEEQHDSNFSGYQYAYNLQGNLIEKREYYEGILVVATYYEYDDDMLTLVYGEDMTSDKRFECRVDNGLIVEKNFFDSDGNYSYRYTYDENKNLVESTFLYEGEVIPNTQYSYTAVTVDAARARYLQEQQKYLIAMTLN